MGEGTPLLSTRGTRAREWLPIDAVDEGHSASFESAASRRVDHTTSPQRAASLFSPGARYELILKLRITNYDFLLSSFIVTNPWIPMAEITPPIKPQA